MKNKAARPTVSMGSLRRIFNHLGSELGKHRGTLFAGMFCMLGVTVTELLRPWPMKIIFDGLLVPQQQTTDWIAAYCPSLLENPQLLLGIIVGVILVVAAFAGIFGYWQSYLTASVGQKVVAAIRHRVYNHIQRLSHSFHDDSSTGDLLARLTGDIRMMRELLVNAVTYVCDRSLVVICMLIVMALMDWQLTLVAVAIIPTLLIITMKFSSNIKEATRKQRRRESEITHTMTEKLSAISIVQSFAREAHEAEQFARQNNKSLKAGLVATRMEARMNRYVQVILAVGTAAVLWLEVARVQSGLLTPGDLLIFTAYLTSLYKPIRKLSSLTSRIAKASACGERIVTILETQPEICDYPDAIPATGLRGEIKFENISFSYPNGMKVLENASFHVAPGETVAIVGKSGIGKSTLARLLFRFYEPHTGRILVDGKDIRQYQLESLRQQLAIVLQETLLFNTSVRNNIAYGKLDAEDAEDAEIVAAVKAANAHNFIEQLPMGYDTVISERGASLSGGQRQRIAIARAIIRQAPLIVLDEPTASLDHFGKREVEDALLKLTAKSTCLLISHDLTHVLKADRILGIEAGQVTELDHNQWSNSNTPNMMHWRLAQCTP